MSTSPFFNTERLSLTLREAYVRLTQNDPPMPAKHLADICDYMANAGKEFDERCQISIESIGSRFFDLLTELRRNFDEMQVDLLSAIVYRFATEYNISSAEDLPMEIRIFMQYTETRESSLPENVRDQLFYARQALPVTILKKLLNSNEITNLRSIKKYSESIGKRFDEWEGILETRQRDANRLGELFEKHARDFNFSGLHTGFSDMATRIKTELRFSQLGLAVFGLLLFVPAAVELYYLKDYIKAASPVSVPTLIATGAGTFTVTMIILYFFRIALRKADSCRAQLMQIHLRMSLCRFIQPYTDYSKDVREKHSETFSKFEALIFSGIVGTTEKIPSTFDGVDQIAAIVKSIRGGKD